MMTSKTCLFFVIAMAVFWGWRCQSLRRADKSIKIGSIGPLGKSGFKLEVWRRRKHGSELEIAHVGREIWKATDGERSKAWSRWWWHKKSGNCKKKFRNCKN